VEKFKVEEVVQRPARLMILYIFTGKSRQMVQKINRHHFNKDYFV